MNTQETIQNDQTDVCDQFPEGSRIRNICEGTANLPLRKLNSYRKRMGLPPVSGADNRPAPKRGGRRGAAKTKSGKPSLGGGCRGCGGRSAKSGAKAVAPVLNGWGPGSMLLKMFEKVGVPHCQDCIDLAVKMDSWRPNGCHRRLKEIVADIVPRAREWLTEEHPAAHKLLAVSGTEDAALKMAIRRKVQKAIKEASAPSRKTLRRKKDKHTRAGQISHRTSDLSNLIESTAIGEPTWTKGTHPKVERIPFVGEPIRNLIYHVYPLRGSDVWRWNLDMIAQRIDLFNGRRVVAIAVGDETESAEAVKDRLGSEVVEYMVFRNNKHAGEMSSFVPLLAQMESDDPNQVTFRAHTKCVVRCLKKKKPHLRDWAEMLYRTSLEDWPLVQKHLEEAAMTGSCRKFDQFNKRRPTNKPSYSGTFYWFRNCFVFSRAWYTVDSPRWGCESWPAKMFSKEETRCLCLDNTNSMYSPAYWKSTVKPAYDKWLSERGLS